MAKSPPKKPQPKSAVKLSTAGDKELLAKLRALKDVSVSQEVAQMLGSVGNGFRKLAYQKMRENNWPKETLENEGFVDKRWPQSLKRARVSILFGFARGKTMRGARPGYVEWGGPGVRRPQKRTPVKKIGMSLLTLFEYGGGNPRKVGTMGAAKQNFSWVWARPAWRPALVEYRKTAREEIRKGMNMILRRVTGEESYKGKYRELPNG